MAGNDKNYSCNLKITYFKVTFVYKLYLHDIFSCNISCEGLLSHFVSLQHPESVSYLFTLDKIFFREINAKYKT